MGLIINLFVLVMTFLYTPHINSGPVVNSNTIIRKGRPLKAGECRPYNTKNAFFCVKPLSVYDGDTIKILIPGVHPVLGNKIGIRILGIDTPEIRGKSECEKRLAVMARNHLSKIIFNASKIDIRNAERGKYFRILANVYADNRNVSYDMIKSGLARDYWGGLRKGWENSCGKSSILKSNIDKGK